MVKRTHEIEIKKKHIASIETRGSITLEYFFHFLKQQIQRRQKIFFW